MKPIFLPKDALNDESIMVDDFCWMMDRIISRDSSPDRNLKSDTLCLYHALIYEGEVNNGGHEQYRANSGHQLEIFASALNGLRLIGASPFVELMQSFILWAEQHPSDTLEPIDWSDPSTYSPPELRRLDDLYSAASDTRGIRTFALAWLRQSPDVNVISREEFNNMVLSYEAEDKTSRRRWWPIGFRSLAKWVRKFRN